MNFSVEELYFLFAQFDAFVMLEFHQGSKSYEMFGKNGLMGSFKFTRYEKIGFEKLRDIKEIPRTEGPVKFFPSKLSDYSTEIQTLLDRDGFLCSDISLVNSSIRKRENRFSIKGEKEVPNTLTINVTEDDASDLDFLTMGLYRARVKDGGKLLPFEHDEWWGKLLYYNPAVTAELPEIYTDANKTKVRNEVRLHFLKCKQQHRELSDEEQEEKNSLWKEVFNKKEPILVSEIGKNGLPINHLRDLEQSDLVKAIAFLTLFNDDTILPYKHPIWCDFERLAHIYIGHAKELYIGKPDNRTFFQYKTKEIRNVLSIILQTVYDDYLEVVTKNPKGNWGRRGPRAIEFDGNYYRLEIEPNGRLLTFHPYNNFEEANKDV